jgi:hypothetical protein
MGMRLGRLGLALVMVLAVLLVVGLEVQVQAEGRLVLATTPIPKIQWALSTATPSVTSMRVDTSGHRKPKMPDGESVCPRLDLRRGRRRIRLLVVGILDCFGLWLFVGY